jgi:hypothetical protein
VAGNRIGCGCGVSNAASNGARQTQLLAKSTPVRAARTPNPKCNKPIKKLKNLIQVMVRYLGTGQPVRYWCQDESRLGLKTITGRQITRPVPAVSSQERVGWQRENFYLYGAAASATGDSFFYEFSHLERYCFESFLNHFSQQFPDRLNLVQLDNSSFHKSVTLCVD